MRQGQFGHGISDTVRVVACIVLDEETCGLPKAAPLWSWSERGEVHAPQVGSGLSRFNSRCVLCLGRVVLLAIVRGKPLVFYRIAITGGAGGIRPPQYGGPIYFCRPLRNSSP
jgi:hypothetical protein